MKTRIVIQPQDTLKSPICVTIEEPGTVPGWRKLHSDDDRDTSDLWTVLVVPGIDATARWLHLPTRNEAQARAAARMQLEDELALGAEELHLALGPLEKDGHRLAVAVSRERIRAWIEEARRYGLSPDVLIPDHLALHEPTNEETIAAEMADGTVVVRGARMAFSCDRDLVPMLLKDKGAIQYDQIAAGHLIAQGALKPAVNLLQGEFAVRRRGRLLDSNQTRIALLAGLLLASPVLMNLGQALQLHVSAQGLRTESAAVAASVLPDGISQGTLAQDSVPVLQERLRQLDLASGGGSAGRVAKFFSALESIPDIQIEGLTMAGGGGLRASLRHATAADLDRLSGTLRKNVIEMRVETSRQEAGQIVSDVRLGGGP